MGCGKSSVGRELSRLLCCPFMDLDDVIEEKSGRTIPEIFAAGGEIAFRQMELATVQSMVEQLPEETVVLALGGGTVITPECAELVHEKTSCVYLRASVETLTTHLEGESSGRPMIHGNLQERIEELLSQRADIYEKTAHIIIDTDGKSIEAIASEISASLD